jgi:hypothetical protein
VAGVVFADYKSTFICYSTCPAEHFCVCQVFLCPKVKNPIRVNIIVSVVLKMVYNGLALGAVADFEAINCQPSTKFDTR